ncbi:MAG: hypothetical protein ACRCT8_05455 [Lacipirellulaceae bacterium]
MLLSVGCLAAGECSAALLYQLIDYPALQNGYSLSGTIEVSDDAATDGTLTAEEILDWRWRAEGPLVYTGQFRPTPILGTPTRAVNVQIDGLGIYLLSTGTPRLQLQEYLRGGRASDSVDAVWIAVDGSFRYGLLGVREGDIGYSVWLQTIDPSSFPQGRLQIAAIVPEPTTVALVSAVVVLSTIQRTKRSR